MDSDSSTLEMGDSENVLPPSKKRIAGRELSRDDPELDADDDSSELETGTFRRASDEVLASRRIVKVRRHQPVSSATSNPFAGICLVPKTGSPPVNQSDSAAKSLDTAIPPQSVTDKTCPEEVDSVAKKKKADENEEKQKLVSVEEIGHSNEELSGAVVDKPNGTGKDNNDVKNEVDGSLAKGTDKEKDDDSVEKATEGDRNEVEPEDRTDNPGTVPGETTEKASVSSFQQLSSSQNAFTGLTGTGFSTSSFSFGAITKGGSFGSGSSAFGAGSGFLFGLNGNKTYPFGVGNSNNGDSTLKLFGTGASEATKSDGSALSSMPEVPVETGEENEKAVFVADATLFEYLDGGWKERGKGELKVNVSATSSEKARLVMRARGHYRLILNANLYPDMKLTTMEKKGITFACMNSDGEGKSGFSTFALKFKGSSFVEEFQQAVTVYIGKQSTVLKTPENSPKASDD